MYYYHSKLKNLKKPNKIYLNYFLFFIFILLINNIIASLINKNNLEIIRAFAYVAKALNTLWYFMKDVPYIDPTTWIFLRHGELFVMKWLVYKAPIKTNSYLFIIILVFWLNIIMTLFINISNLLNLTNNKIYKSITTLNNDICYTIHLLKIMELEMLFIHTLKKIGINYYYFIK